MRSIKLGNVAIDGEVLGKGWRMALELKKPQDDITRGIGQLSEALAYGYDQVAMVTTSIPLMFPVKNEVTGPLTYYPL